MALAASVLVYAGLARKSLARLLFLPAALLLLFFSSAFGSRLLLLPLENRYPGNIGAAPSAEAIVVLGGGIADTSIHSGLVQLGPNADRLWTAVELYRAGKSPLILVAGGGSQRGQPPPPAESVLAARILQAWGVPASAILTEEQSRDTHQNAVFSRRILAAKGIGHILLVTSAVHMPRASATFRRAGFTVFPVPAAYLVGPDDEGLFLSLLPNAGALADSSNALKEWLGLAAYRLRGWSD